MCSEGVVITPSVHTVGESWENPQSASLPSIYIPFLCAIDDTVVQNLLEKHNDEPHYCTSVTLKAMMVTVVC